MKSAIHPTYYNDAVVSCACGNTFTTGSVKQQLPVEICSACHPFFTGEMKYVDTAGRVDKFMSKVQAASQASYVKKKDKRQAKIAAQKAALASAPQTMREMMDEVKKQAASSTKSSPTN
jgi:large subunit ribosomal protein L31